MTFVALLTLSCAVISLTRGTEMGISFGKLFAGVDSPDDDWNYDLHSPKGPLSWHKNHTTCKGSAQSPVNLQIDPTSFYQHCDETVALSLKNYDMPIYGKFENTGSLLKFIPHNKYQKLTSSFLEVEYILEEVRFHWGNNSQEGGSEHAVNGKRLAMEIQLFHKPDPLELKKRSDLPFVVLSMLVKPSLLDNSKLEQITSVFPYIPKPKDTREVRPPLVLRDLMPRSQAFYMYRGSESTPPCKENVIWIIYNEQITVSEKQLMSFRSIYRDSPGLINNFRPVQAMNGRKIFQSCLAESSVDHKLSSPLYHQTQANIDSTFISLNDQPAVVKSTSAREAGHHHHHQHATTHVHVLRPEKVTSEGKQEKPWHLQREDLTNRDDSYDSSVASISRFGTAILSVLLPLTLASLFC